MLTPLPHRSPSALVFPPFFSTLSKRYATQGRFTALPGNGHFRSALRFDHLVDVGFEQVICHAKAAVGIELLLREEKAIRAIKVAGRPGRLAQHMKRGGGIPGPCGRCARHGCRCGVCWYQRDDLGWLHIVRSLAPFPCYEQKTQDLRL